MRAMNTASHAPLPPLVKMALEFGPLGLFFLANSRPELFRPLLALGLDPALLDGKQAGIFAATAVFMVAIAVALAVQWSMTRTLPVMPVVSGVVVLVFGGLTLILQDELFIKLKPTIVNMLFGTVLLGGLALGRPLLPYVLDSVLSLTPAGWQQLTLRWGIFFFVLAAINEFIWRSFSTDFWVNFKVFGMMPITLAFALAQTPLILRHTIAHPEETPPS